MSLVWLTRYLLYISLDVPSCFFSAETLGAHTPSCLPGQVASLLGQDFECSALCSSNHIDVTCAFQLLLQGVGKSNVIPVVCLLWVICFPTPKGFPCQSFFLGVPEFY